MPDAELVNAVKSGAESAGAMVEIVAPQVGGVKLSDGSHMPGNEKIDGGPSVLYDAVAVIVSEEGAGKLASMLPGKQFVADAFGHCKFIAYSDAAETLLNAGGVTDRDEGMIALKSASDAETFLKACVAMRFWQRAG